MLISNGTFGSTYIVIVICLLPDTATVPNPAGVLIPNCVAYNAFGFNPYGVCQNGSIWS